MINFDKTIFNINIPSPNPTQGSLLVAEPFLRDACFHHGVIALIDHDSPSGSMGVVMNRQTSHTLQSVLDSVKVKTPIPLFCGGPMSVDRLFFVHTLDESIIPGSRTIAPGLFVGGDFDSMLDYVNDGYPIDGHVRFFLGYSGWSPGQLDEEISNSVWAVASIPSAHQLLSGTEDAYWHRCVRMLGNDYRGWRYHPRNPHSN
ncbi:MAG: YqgE/AlgH family protein [Firmicutes bacterium]|nr:YqgE/AlgH family protein [Bacillota bacterium]MCM1401970.1 YqgE/AlgH family protein [Bacteroides sp.]MCM1477909.1 YqgE/AlgH family protein [Bacteroides sp.]